jgi:hypothetical protein
MSLKICTFSQGVLSGLVVNGLRLLDMGTDRDPRVRMVGQVHQIASIGSIPSTSLKDDLHFMQKVRSQIIPPRTLANQTVPSFLDDGKFDAWSARRLDLQRRQPLLA